MRCSNCLKSNKMSLKYRAKSIRPESFTSLSEIAVVKDDTVRYMKRQPALDLLTSKKDKKIEHNFLQHAYKILTVNSFGIECVVQGLQQSFRQHDAGRRWTLPVLISHEPFLLCEQVQCSSRGRQQVRVLREATD